MSRPAESNQVAVDPASSAEIPRYGVVGYPVSHSRSPAIHAAAYAQLGIAADYQRLPVPPPLLSETVRALAASGFKGVNVTIPHKQAALKLADAASPAAQRIGAANTLSFAGGRITADNTDAPGMIAAIGGDLAGSAVLVLGAGGTARAAVYALTNAGAQVKVWNRTAQRARLIAEEFNVEFTESVDTEAASADLIVNTTAVGMNADETAQSVSEALNLQLDVLRDETVIVDFVYRGTGSPLTLAAHDRGLRVVDGLELLVRQAAISFEIWFGREAPLEVMRRAAAG